jgi:hypothetical protein
MNCVYSGFEAIEHWVDTFELPVQPDTSANNKQTALFTKLISFYLLCIKLIDFKAANMVIDEVIRFSDLARVIPPQAASSLAYTSTAQGAPLRALLRDYWMYKSGNVERLALRADDFSVECLQDVILAALDRLDKLPLERANLNMSVRTLCLRDKCRYHLHDHQHPQCGAKEERNGM